MSKKSRKIILTAPPNSNAEGQSAMNGSPAAQIGKTECGAVSDGAYQAYLDERKSLCNAEFEVAKAFDNYLLTLSGGAIAVSMAFVKELVNRNATAQPWLLSGAWIIFAAVIVSCLSSMLMSQRAHEDFRDIMDEECEKGGDDFWTRVRKKQNTLRRPVVIKWLNRVNLGFFFAGVFLLAVFAFLNWA